MSFRLTLKGKFMKNPKNKENLNHFLAKKFLQIRHTDIIMVITRKNGILTNDTTLRTDPIISSFQLRHMLQFVLTGVKTIVVKTVDTDVFFVAFGLPSFRRKLFFKVFVWLGISELKSCFYSIDDVAPDLGEDVWQALPFSHACTGCDTVSSFFYHDKFKFWDRWFNFESESLLTKVFSELSQRPTNITVEQATHLEKYLLSVYYPHMTAISDLNFQRMQNFEYLTHSNLRFLPPSKAGRIEHIKRAAFEACWVAYQCKENVDLPSPELWDWKLTKN